PCSTRGILKTPASRRLYHNTNPSRSHTKIFKRSPRRERNTNRWPLCGFSPTTAFTRSASRSNPQRMSVASLAIQIRAPCERSIACKLGSPITLLPPPPPAIPAHVPDQILALPSGSGHSAAALRSASRPPRWPGTPPIALPRISPSRFPAAVSSTNSNATGTTPALDRTPPHSSRSASVRKSACATSSMLFCFVFVASSRNFAMRRPFPARCGSRSAHRLSAFVRHRCFLAGSPTCCDCVSVSTISLRGHKHQRPHTHNPHSHSRSTHGENRTLTLVTSKKRKQSPSNRFGARASHAVAVTRDGPPGREGPARGYLSRKTLSGVSSCSRSIFWRTRWISPAPGGLIASQLSDR